MCSVYVVAVNTQRSLHLLWSTKDVFNGYAMGRGQHMYEFMDSSDASVVIRPDLTMPIGRFLATTNIELPLARSII